jgi:hypothetical protein
MTLAAFFIFMEQPRINLFLKFKKTIMYFINTCASILFLAIVFLWAINERFMSSMSTWELTWTFYSGFGFMFFLIMFFLLYNFRIVIIKEKTKKIFMLGLFIIAVSQSIQWLSYSNRFERFMKTILFDSILAYEKHTNFFDQNMTLRAHHNKRRYNLAVFFGHQAIYYPFLTYDLDKMLVPIFYFSARGMDIGNIFIKDNNDGSKCIKGQCRLVKGYCRAILRQKHRLEKMGINIFNEYC